MNRFLLVVLFFSAGLLAQDQKLFWDGHDWVRLTERTAGDPQVTYLTKSSYLNGLQDGRLYDYYKLWPADSLLVTEHLKPELDDYLSTAELIRTLDSFYNEPLKRYIPVASAVLIVNMIAQGQPPSVIEEYTRLSKEWINSLMLEIQNQDRFEMMREKQEAKRKR